MVSANMVVTDHASSNSDCERGHALATLRGILVSSLSRENLSPHDIDSVSSPDSPPVAPARRKRKVTFLDNNTAGAAPVEPSQRHGSRPSSAKQGSSNCLAGEGVSEVSDGTSPPRDQGKENALQREERLRLVKEKQNEERQRKLEELKQQALATQKFREQKEEERRKRLEEMRVRDCDRRQQVEERKRQIWEAERDRREAILRKNQEREARIESKKKNERSSIVFAFGSSTPRMLEPADTGGSYWATRRATSTSNVMMLSMSAAPGPLTRRSSERELDGSKKRATSAGGIHRSKAEDAARLTASSIYDVFQWDSPPERSTLMSPVDVTHSISPLADAVTTKVSGEEIDGECSSTPIPISTAVRAARRKTDLMPTLPSPRDLTPGRGQTSRPIRSPGFRSGEVTPSRPQSSLSQHSVSSGAAMMSSSVHSALKSRPQTAPRRQRPYSIAVTGITSTPSSPDTNKPNVTLDHRNAKSPSVSGTDKPPIPKVHAAKKPLTPKPDLPKKPVDKLTKSAKSSASPTPKATPLQSPGVEVPTAELISVEATTKDGTATTTTFTSVTTVVNNTEEGGDIVETTVHNEVTFVSDTADNESVTETTITKIEESTSVVQPEPVIEPAPAAEPVKEEPVQQQEPSAESVDNEMTASMIAKTRITTEEEAKAALAERRRLAREQAEREAELERQRLEAERLAEEERLRQEEEEQRRMEEEQLRLLEEARKAEEERLRLAIEEAQKREEEEKRRKEEEAKLKVEKEEAERKAKEEAEKQRQEMELRLKKEEEDRQARRKRVEAIMLRTRGKGTTPTSTPTKEDGDDSPNEEAKQEPEKMNIQETFLNSERSHTDASITAASVPKHNGHQNGVDNVVDQNNVTNSLLDLSLESDSTLHQSIQPQPIGEQIIVAPTTTTPTNGKLANEDNVNFNTPPPTSPFIAFQDNKKQDATVNDLLS